VPNSVSSLFGSYALMGGEKQPVESWAIRRGVVVLQCADVCQQLFGEGAQFDVRFLGALDSSSP
jgi:hypothetical protein